MSSASSPSSQSTWAVFARRTPWIWLGGALLLFFVRFGYGYGYSDQDEIIPFLLHRLHPELFTQDWFVMSQAAEFGIRSYFVTMLQSLALFMPVWLAVLLVFMVTWLLLASAVYTLGWTFTRNRLAALLAVVLVLVLTPRWTLGGNDLTSSILVPSMVAWCLALWGLVLYLHRRVMWSGVLLGLATWAQALVGLQVAGLLGLILLIEAVRHRQWQEGRAVLIFGAAFLLSALPSLGPLVYQQLSADVVTAMDMPSMFYIMGVFRNPHHYLFDAFPLRSKFYVSLLVVLGGVSFWWLTRKQRVCHERILVQLFGLVLMLCLVGYVFTEVQPTLFIAKLQLFKSTVLAKVLLLILISGAAFRLLPSRIEESLDRLVAHPWLGPVGMAIAYLLVLVGIFLQFGPLYSKARPLAHTETHISQIEQWAQGNTPTDAVFAVPPTWSGFRSLARRAIVVNFKSFPYNDALIPVWYERLTEMAPLPPTDDPDPFLQARLDSAFLHQPAENLAHLATRYDFDYLVQDRMLEDSNFLQVFAAPPWIVYEVVSPTTETE